MYSIAIITAGLKPVPAVRGGAVEHLTTLLINENEKYNHFYFDVYTLADSELNIKDYHNTKLIQINNYQHVLPIRATFSIINRTCRILGIKKHFDYMSVVIPMLVRQKYKLIVVENNLQIFFGLKKRFPNIKIVFHLHNDFDTVRTDYDKTKERIVKLGQQAAAVWTASKYLKTHISQVIDGGNIRVLENCINREKYYISDQIKEEGYSYRKMNGITDDEFVIMFCGRFDRWKGALELLQAITLLPTDINLKILLVGSQWFASREERQYEIKMDKMIKQLGNKVVKCGYIPQAEMPKLYSASNVVAIPSQGCEAFGMTALEAITMGKPCLASACGGLLDILDKSCAELIPQGEQYSKDLAIAIDRLYHNKIKLKQLSDGALEKSKQFNDEKQYYKRFVELVHELMGIKSLA